MLSNSVLSNYVFSGITRTHLEDTLPQNVIYKKYIKGICFVCITEQSRVLLCQISDIQVKGQSDDMTAKEKLLLWSQRMVEGYQDLCCDNFTSRWRDGKLFNAIIHKHR